MRTELMKGERLKVSTHTPMYNSHILLINILNFADIMVSIHIENVNVSDQICWSPMGLKSGMLVSD